MELSNNFLLLLRSGLCESAIDGDVNFSPSEWADILSLARNHTVTGLIYRGVSLLPESVEVPEDVLVRLMMEAESIERHSRKVSAAADEVISLLRFEGLSPLILKGPEVARFYSSPDLRVSGDIDLFVGKREMQRALEVLAANGAAIEKSPDGSSQCKFKDVPLDFHDRYYDLHCSERHLPPYPSAEATILMLSSHILKHAMGPGVGMRQMCDIALACNALAGSCDKAALLRAFRASGTVRWNRMLAAFLRRYLGVISYPLDDGGVSPEPLARIVEEGGNFGHHSAARAEALKGSESERKRDTARLMLSRAPFALRCAPRQFVCRTVSLALGNLRLALSRTRN